VLQGKWVGTLGWEGGQSFEASGSCLENRAVIFIEQTGGYDRDMKKKSGVGGKKKHDYKTERAQPGKD